MVRTAERKKATKAPARRRAEPHVIARKYLSPDGVREISSSRLTEAIQAVKDGRLLKAAKKL